MLNRTLTPPIKDAVEFDLQLKPYTKYVLDNGTEVYAIDAGAQDVVQLEWVYKAGNWQEDENLVAATVNNLLKNGTSTKTAFQINAFFEYYGAYLNRSCSNENASISLHCLAKHVDALLPVVQEVLTDSVFPEEEIALYKQNNKQRLLVNLKKCDFVANRLIDQYLFGANHPYGKISSPEAYDALTQEQLVKFYQKYYVQGNCRIFVAGKLPANVFMLLNTHFGKLAINTAPLPTRQYAIQPAENQHFTVKNDAAGVQGAIRIGTAFPNRHHPHFAKAQVLNCVFGGFFGSRLMSNIREDKGYTYGIHSYIHAYPQQSAWIVSTEAGSDVCQATIKEVYNEMQRLCNEPVAEEELLLVRNYIMGGILGELDGPFQIIAKWKNIIVNDLTESYFTNYIQTVKTISAKELQELANQYLLPENFYELVVI